MRHQPLVLALAALILGCTPKDAEDTVDTTVPIDTEDTQDTDVGPTDPYCGDGAVDDGEQCDQGDANGPDGDCSSACAWNGWVTCDMLTGPVVTLGSADAQPDGTWHVAGRFTGALALTVDCADDATHNVAVAFEVPEAGSYLVSTANAGNEGATVLSLRTDCDDRAELTCGALNAPVAGGSQAFIEDAEAGASYVALIALADGDPGGWHLSLTPIDSVAALGDACDALNPCGEGLVCSSGEALDTCTTNTAPTLTSATLTQIDTYDYRLTVHGSDPNRDLAGLRVPLFEDDMGDTWGDDPGEDPVVLDAPTVTWNGDAFTAVTVVSTSFYATGMGTTTTMDVSAVDRAGLHSAAVSVTYPEPTSNALQNYIGDACDMCVDCQNTSGFPRYCNPNTHNDPADASVQIPALSCTWDDDTHTTASCEDRSFNDAPVPGVVHMYWEGTAARLHVEAYDTRHLNGMNAEVTVVFVDTTTLTLPNVFLGTYTWDRGQFVGTGPVNTTSVTKEVSHLSVRLVDQGNPKAASEAFDVPWVPYAAPVEVGQGEVCDLRGWEQTCAAPYVCSPTLSGVPGCALSQAPELYAMSGSFSSGTMTFDFQAADANADWHGLQIETTQYPPFVLEASTWTPDTFGRQTWTGQTFAMFGTWLYETRVADRDGNLSNPMIAMGAAPLAAGAACSTTGGGACHPLFGCPVPTDYCDVAAGLTCSNRQGLEGTEKVCEEAVAPSLDSVVVKRTGNKKYTVDFTGKDPNGDASKIVVVQIEDGVETVPSLQIDNSVPINGSTSFSGRFTNGANGSIANPLAEVKLRIKLKDWAFLSSNELEVTVPPIIEAGDTCSNDDTVDRCWDATECQDGTCFVYEPQLAAATVSYERYGRDARVTVKGYDDKTGTSHQLKTVSVTLAGTTVSKNLPTSGGNAPVWSGNEFTVFVVVPNVGAGPLAGEQFVTASVVDAGGFEGRGTYFFPTNRHWGESCDPLGEYDRCIAGTFCAAGTCENDYSTTQSTCAGSTLIVADGDTVQYDISALTTVNYEDYPGYASCGSTTNRPNGRDIAVAYTATQDGTLTIRSTDGGSGTLTPGYLFVRFDHCTDYDAVVACSNLSTTTGGSANAVTIDVLEGETLFVTVDGPSWPNGKTGSLSFSYADPVE